MVAITHAMSARETSTPTGEEPETSSGSSVAGINAIASSGGYAYGAGVFSEKGSGSTYGSSPARTSSAARRKIAKSYGTCRPPSERSELAQSVSSCQRSAAARAPIGSRIATASTHATTSPTRPAAVLATPVTVPWADARIAGRANARCSRRRYRLRRSGAGDVAADHVLEGRGETARDRVVDASLQPHGRLSAETRASMHAPARGRLEAVRSAPERRRLHRDLRRPAEGTRRRLREGPTRPRDVHPQQRLRDRTLAADIAVARAAGRRRLTEDARRYHRRP